MISPKDGALGDGFGSALAVDGNLLAIGAPGADGGGAVYVFERGSGGALDPAGPAHRPGGADGDRFGAAVALKGGCCWWGRPAEKASGAWSSSAGAGAPASGSRAGDPGRRHLGERLVRRVAGVRRAARADRCAGRVDLRFHQAEAGPGLRVPGRIPGAPGPRRAGWPPHAEDGPPRARRRGAARRRGGPGRARRSRTAWPARSSAIVARAPRGRRPAASRPIGDRARRLRRRARSRRQRPAGRRARRPTRAPAPVHVFRREGPSEWKQVQTAGDPARRIATRLGAAVAASKVSRSPVRRWPTSSREPDCSTSATAPAAPGGRSRR